MEQSTLFETKFSKPSTNEERPAASTVKRPSLNEKPLKQEKSEGQLPSITKEPSQKKVKLAYSLSNETYKNHLLFEEPFSQNPGVANYITRIQNVSVVPYNQRGAIMSQKAQASNPVGAKTTKAAKGTRRVRPPKTQFKIIKSNANIEKLENVLVEFIDKNKLLKSSNDEIIMKPQNRMQAAINSLRAVNKILPKSNLVQHTFGYDEANLSKNHLILEKVMLERITKTKLRRQEEKLAKAQTEGINQINN